MSDVKPITKQNITSPNQFQIVLKTNQKQITSKTSSTLGGVPFVPQSLDFARDVSGNILPLLCQINFADMPAIPGFPIEGLFQLYQTDSFDDCGYEVLGDDVVIRFLKPEQLLEQVKDMSEYDQTKTPWMMEVPTAKNIIGTKAAYKVKSKHTIGGKPRFTQTPDHQDCVNFIQFDSEDGLMIGECGIMHIFIKKEDLEELNFEKAIFYFDN
ncbi:Conserved_hypothetical protein [Hexamita inflata]|uniref:DUF1963 domain-containing protein n=1 Tax=Hexamita inflata TaxID=28002 RepID=A0AA86UJP5_9EUKA|nr:Conserved hypothetical protein [Hexamita inflata]